MTTTYRVTAPYILLTSAVSSRGAMTQGFGVGALVPPDVPAEQIEHNLRMGYIEALPDEPDPPPDEGDH